MATISFDRLASGTIKVTNGTNPVVYYAGLEYELNPNAANDVVVIKISNGDEYRLEAADTVNVNGAPTTGTNATEIAEDLATDIFFLASGSGDVVGPGSSTDNALARYDGATGELIQDSNAILTDGGNLTLVGDNLQLFKSWAGNTSLDIVNENPDGIGNIGVSMEAASLYLVGYSSSGGHIVQLQANGESELVIDPSSNKINIRSTNILFTDIGEYANDAAAATGGVPVRGLYHTSGALKIRLA